MARHEVFKEVAESLAACVRRESDRQKTPVEVVVGPPDAGFYAGKSNAVAIYLYHLAVDYADNEHTEELVVEGEDELGTYTIVYPRAVITRLHFAVAARGGSHDAELLTLSLALKAFVEHPTLAGDAKKGANLPPERDLPVDVDTSFDFTAQRELSQSLGVPFHPMLGYRVITEIQPERELRRSRKVERRSIEIFDRLRPPDGKGEDADRRPPARTAKR